MNTMSKSKIYSRFLMWFMALMLSALAAGCGGGGDSAPDVGPAGLAPTVTDVSTGLNVTAVPVNTKLINAAFTSRMDPATFTAASFTLACPVGTPITGTVAFPAAGSLATFRLPAATNLPANTVCTATITTAVKDLAGNALASNFVWTFTTGPATALDITAPTVSGTTNLNGATNVPVNTKITMTFSEAIDPDTVNATTFTVMQGATPVAGTVSYTGVTAVFTPAATLAANTNYTVTATTGIKDVAGNAMAGNFAISWTTAAVADTTAPTITGTVNASGATNVAVNNHPGATFSEAMDPLTVTTATVTLMQTLTSTPVAGTVANVGVNVVFTPLSNLAPNTNYTVTVKGGASGVKDLAGNALAGSNTPAGDFAWSWVTAATVDATAPTISGTAHTNGQTDVPINTKASVTFSEAMDPLTISTANVRLQETVSSVAVPATLSYAGVTATLIPLSNLKPNTGYTVTVLNGVKDLAGNPMINMFQVGWTTAATPDTTAPTVSTTAQANGQTGVAINTKVSANFSEAMDPLTITNLTFRLQETASSAAVAGTVSYSGVTALFTPASNLKPNTAYTLTVLNGVEDLAGNAMVNMFQVGWTTAATLDTTSPTVTGTAPVSLATNVAINARASVIFSEAMDPLTITDLTVRLQETASSAVVPGTLSYTGVTATIVPLGNLKPNTAYTVTVLNGVKDLAGNPMINMFQVGWTTAATVDTTAPTVTLQSPANLETNVAVNKHPYAFFSEWMDPLTLTTATVLLTGPGGAPVAGTVLTGGTIDNVLFTPLINLAPNTTYTATITTGAKDVAGNALAANKVWSFTTAAIVVTPPPQILPANPTAPTLGEAGRFVILASQNVTGDAASSVSNGDIGILDQARAFITGFTPVGVSPNLGGFAELTNGMSYAANDLCPAPFQCPLKFSTLPVGAPWVDAATMIVQVRTDSQAAFTFLAANPNPGAPTQVAPIELGNLVLTRGVYRNGANIGITTGPLHLDAQGDPNSVFIIVTDGTFTTGAAGSIVLDNLAQAKNVYWLSAGNATIAAGTTFYGNMFAVPRLDVLAGANVTGRLFARNDRVTLISNIVTKAP